MVDAYAISHSVHKVNAQVVMSLPSFKQYPIKISKKGTTAK